MAATLTTSELNLGRAIRDHMGLDTVAVLRKAVFTELVVYPPDDPQVRREMRGFGELLEALTALPADFDEDEDDGIDRCDIDRCDEEEEIT